MDWIFGSCRFKKKNITQKSETPADKPFSLWQRRKKEAWLYSWHAGSSLVCLPNGTGRCDLSRDLTLGREKCFDEKAFAHLPWEVSHNYMVLILKKCLFFALLMFSQHLFLSGLGLINYSVLRLAWWNKSLCYLDLFKTCRWLLCSLPCPFARQDEFYTFFSLIGLILLLCKLFQSLFSEFSSKMVYKSEVIRCPNASWPCAITTLNR